MICILHSKHKHWIHCCMCNTYLWCKHTITSRYYPTNMYYNKSLESVYSISPGGISGGWWEEMVPLSAPTLRVVETLRRAGLERPRVGATGDSIWQYNEQQSSVLKNWCRKITRCIVFDFFVHHIVITNNVDYCDYVRESLLQSSTVICHTLQKKLDTSC